MADLGVEDRGLVITVRHGKAVETSHIEHGTHLAMCPWPPGRIGVRPCSDTAPPTTSSPHPPSRRPLDPHHSLEHRGRGGLLQNLVVTLTRILFEGEPSRPVRETVRQWDLQEWRTRWNTLTCGH